MSKKPVKAKSWTPREATDQIRSWAKADQFRICWTKHVKEQMNARGIIMGDVLHLLKNGFIFEPAQPSTRDGFFKYMMECKTPNSNNRTLRAVVIPSPQRREIKVVTIMWVDEGRVSS